MAGMARPVCSSALANSRSTFSGAVVCTSSPLVLCVGDDAALRRVAFFAGPEGAGAAANARLPSLTPRCGLG